MHELDRGELKERMQRALEMHQGPDDCITMYQLYHAVTGRSIIPARKVDQTRIIRSIIEGLRREGCPIGNKGGSRGGYFWARNQTELDSTISVFHSRAMSSLQQEAALKRIRPGELLSQYELELQEETTNG